MNYRAEQFWFQVRDAAVGRREYGAAGASLIIEKQLFNKHGFPLLKNLRELSQLLAKKGYRNGKGNPYHPDQLRVAIYKALADLTLVVMKVKPTKELRNMLFKSVIEGCTQRVHDDLPDFSEEDETRMSWLGNPRLRKAKQQVTPWDQDLESEAA